MEEEFRLSFLLKPFRGTGLQFFLSFAVSLIALSDGLLDGWIAEKISQLTSSNTTLAEASLIGTLAYYANIAILPFAVYSANKIGRKWTIIWGGLFVFSSWAILYYAEKIELIYLGVFCEGCGMFVAYTIVEVYIAEIAQANIRGFLCSCVPVLVNLGVLSSYVCTTYMSLKKLTIVGMVTVGMILPCFVWAPKSPHYLIMKNKYEKAKNSLLKLRNSHRIDEELNDIKLVIERNNMEEGSFREFFTDKTNRKVLFVVLGVQVVQQFSGIDTIMIFIEVIFESSNNVLSSSVCMIVFGSCKCIFCVISLVLLDRIGRRPLLIFSCSVSACSLFLMGLYFFLQEVLMYDTSPWSWAPLMVITVYIFGYSVGLGTVTYLLGSEMFPTKFNALGVSVTQLVYVVLVIIMTEICARLRDCYGFYSAFWFLSTLTFAGLIFIYVFVLETKGKTSRQILDELNGVSGSVYAYSSCPT